MPSISPGLSGAPVALSATGLQLAESFKLQRMTALGVLTLSLTDPASGQILENINELQDRGVLKI